MLMRIFLWKTLRLNHVKHFQILGNHYIIHCIQYYISNCIKPRMRCVLVFPPVAVVISLTLWQVCDQPGILWNQSECRKLWPGHLPDTAHLWHRRASCSPQLLPACWTLWQKEISECSFVSWWNCMSRHSCHPIRLGTQWRLRMSQFICISRSDWLLWLVQLPKNV